MTTIFTQFFYKIMVMLLSFSTVLGLGINSPATNDPIRAKNSESIKLSAVLWGDTQVADYMFSRQRNTYASCEDVANAAEKIDALIIAGDITENGKQTEYQLMLDNLGMIDTVEHFLPATGNHDVRVRLYSQTVKNFSTFVNMLSPDINVENLHYSYDINGITFIVLGSSKTILEEAYFSDEDLAWLENELAENTGVGKPTFVVLHQTLKDTHGLPYAWNAPGDRAGTVGKQSDILRGILNKYQNVFLLTGHLHSGLGVNNFNQIGNFVSVNAPAIGVVSKDGGFEAAGTGYMIEVYESSVLFRARNFAAGRYMPEYDREFPIV